MRVLVLLPFLVAAAFVSGQDVSSIYFGRINNGIVREIADTTSAALYNWTFVGREELAGCADFTLKEVLSRKDEFTVSLNCSGTTKWAAFKTTAVTQGLDEPEAPVLGTVGGYMPAAAFEGKLFPWFESIKEDGCDVSYSRCSFQTLPGTIKFTCPINCETTEIHPTFSFVIDPMSNTLVSITDEPTMPGIDKMCTMRMKQMLQQTGINGELILKSVNLNSDISKMNVTTGSFLELLTGVQYCMNVQDGAKETVLSLYQFNLEGTTPFVVALPFDSMPDCEYFLKKVSCQWVAAGEDCAYNM